MIRTAYNRREGEVVQDKIWRPTVERTGGRFYAVYDEESMMRALREIDRLSPGRIDVREYSVQRPRYAGLRAGRDRAVADGGVVEAGFRSVSDVSVNHEEHEEIEVHEDVVDARPSGRARR